MKKIIKFLVVLFATLLLVVGCSSNEETGSETTEGSENENEEETVQDKLLKVKVGYMPNFASVNTAVAGIRIGAFEEEGLEIELVEFADGPTIIAALESGSLDFGYIGPGAHVLPIKGQAEIIAFSHLGNADAVIGNKEKGVGTIEDLKGKKIALASGTSSETILNLTLKEAGISRDEVELYDMDASAIVTAMISGTVDAAATWSPNTSAIMNELGDKGVMLSNNERYAHEFPSITSWVTAPGYAEKNEEIVVKFLRGLYKAMDYRVSNLEEVAEWVAEEIAVEKDSVLPQIFDGVWTTKDELLYMIDDGSMEALYKKQQENFIESGQLEEGTDVPVEEYVRFDLMKKAAE